MTESSTSPAAADELPSESPAATPTATAVKASESERAAPINYTEARRREDQWRIPQLLTALLTPVLAFIGLIFNLGGMETNANISAALAIITGVGAALMAVESWRWHRAATSQEPA
jgi:hypothetical protein